MLEIARHPWTQQPTLSVGELQTELHRRKAIVEEAARKKELADDVKMGLMDGDFLEKGDDERGGDDLVVNPQALPADIDVCHTRFRTRVSPSEIAKISRYLLSRYDEGVFHPPEEEVLVLCCGTVSTSFRNACV
jgi:hypothetical protein